MEPCSESATHATVTREICKDGKKAIDNSLANLTLQSYPSPPNIIHAAFPLGGWMISALFSNPL